MFPTQFNLRSPAIKRLMKEAAELKDPTEDYYAQPLENNLFEWHFTVRGASDSDFQEGIYHGRIILPTEYPMKPPSIIMLTPNGRFEINKKICLSISGHHPETWQPSWSIRTALLAITGFMPTESLGALGALDYSSDERKSLAAKSQSWCCPSCGPIKKLIKDKSDSNKCCNNVNNEEKELAKQILFKEIGPISEIQNYLSSRMDRIEVDTKKPNEIRTRSIINPDPIHHSNSEGRINNLIENNGVESSRTRLSTYFIIVLSLAITFLLFRRLFLTD